MSQGLILFGHGARDPEWARPMAQLAARMSGLAPDVPVTLAFLEFMQPDLDAAAAALVARGVDELVILPIFLAQGGHLKRDLPEMVAGLAQRYPAVRIRLLAAVGEAERVLAAMAEHALGALRASV